MARAYKKVPKKAWLAIKSMLPMSGNCIVMTAVKRFKGSCVSVRGPLLLSTLVNVRLGSGLT